MAWCKVSSLTAAVARSLKGVKYPASRKQILTATRGLVVEGWDVTFFLDSALKQGRYQDIRSVMSDLESWLEQQG